MDNMERVSPFPFGSVRNLLSTPETYIYLKPLGNITHYFSAPAVRPFLL